MLFIENLNYQPKSYNKNIIIKNIILISLNVLPTIFVLWFLITIFKNLEIWSHGLYFLAQIYILYYRVSIIANIINYYLIDLNKIINEWNNLKQNKFRVIKKNLKIIRKIYTILWDIHKIHINCVNWSLLFCLLQNFIDITNNAFWSFKILMRNKMGLKLLSKLNKIIPNI